MRKFAISFFTGILVTILLGVWINEKLWIATLDTVAISTLVLIMLHVIKRWDGWDLDEE